MWQQPVAPSCIRKWQSGLWRGTTWTSSLGLPLWCVLPFSPEQSWEGKKWAWIAAALKCLVNVLYASIYNYQANHWHYLQVNVNSESQKQLPHSFRCRYNRRMLMDRINLTTMTSVHVILLFQLTAETLKVVTIFQPPGPHAEWRKRASSQQRWRKRTPDFQKSWKRTTHVAMHLLYGDAVIVFWMLVALYLYCNA